VTTGTMAHAFALELVAAPTTTIGNITLT
jgi:hypothetical protein